MKECLKCHESFKLLIFLSNLHEIASDFDQELVVVVPHGIHEGAT